MLLSCIPYKLKNLVLIEAEVEYFESRGDLLKNKIGKDLRLSVASIILISVWNKRERDVQEEK